MQRQQKYHETRRKYEQQAQHVANFLMAAWSILWLGLAFLIPSAMGWFVLLWLVGCGTWAGALAKVRLTKRNSAKMLSVTRPLEELYTMNPLDFEHAVAARLMQAGMEQMRVTPSMGDGGIDIVGQWKGRKVAVQCKKYHPDSFISIDQLRAFVYAYRRIGAQVGIYVTTARYSDVARREMAQEGTVLVDGATLIDETRLEALFA